MAFHVLYIVDVKQKWLNGDLEFDESEPMFLKVGRYPYVTDKLHTNAQ